MRSIVVCIETVVESGKQQLDGFDHVGTNPCNSKHYRLFLKNI